MKFSKYYLKLLTLAIASVIVDSQTSSPKPTTDPTTILWSLSPCQSAFWIPSTSSEFAQSWITYQYEGNPLSQFGECIFTLESDSNTRIEMIIQDVHLFGSGVTTPPPCLNLYNIEADGSIVLLKTECSSVLTANALESVSTFTDINLAIISTTIRYGSFQLQARAVPRNFGTPPRVSTTTAMPSTSETTPIVRKTTSTRASTNSSTSTTSTSTSTKNTDTEPTAEPTSPTTQNMTSTTNSSSESTEESTEPDTFPVRKIGQPRVIIKMVSELKEQHEQLPIN